MLAARVGLAVLAAGDADVQGAAMSPAASPASIKGGRGPVGVSPVASPVRVGLAALGATPAASPASSLVSQEGSVVASPIASPLGGSGRRADAAAAESAMQVAGGEGPVVQNAVVGGPEGSTECGEGGLEVSEGTSLQTGGVDVGTAVAAQGS